MKREGKGRARRAIYRTIAAIASRVTGRITPRSQMMAGDQLGGRDVEGRIVDLHAVRRGLPAETVGDLAGVALLDGDLGAAGNRRSNVLVGAAM